MAKADKSDGLKLIESGDRHLQAGRLGKARRAFDQARSAYERMLALRGVVAVALAGLSLSLNRLGAVEQACRKLDAAYERYARSLEIFRKFIDFAGEAPQALRDLGIILGQLANVERMRGRLDGAYARYGQKLDIDRRILALTGETPEVLKDLLVDLVGLADTERARSHLDAAYQHCVEMHEIARRLLDLTGETPQALRGMSISLEQLGSVEEARGNLNTAIEHFEQQLAISRRLLSLTAEMPGALRDLNLNLKRLADIERDCHRLDASYERYKQRLEINRKILTLDGDTTETLRDLSHSLERLANAERDRGQLDAAYERYGQMLDIDRKIVTLTGETTESLRHVVVSLDRLARVDETRGQLDVARERCEQMLDIDRKILARTGKTTEALRNIAISLGRLGGIEQSCGQLDSAYQRYEQRLELSRQILVVTGQTPQALSDLCIGLWRLGSLDQARGRLDSVCERYTEEFLTRCKVLELTNQAPEALRNLSLVFGRLADVERERGQLASAHRGYMQQHAVLTKILALSGESPEALHDLSINLERLGDMERARRQLDAANDRYERKLEIDRQVLALTGETPRALRNLLVSLQRLGDVEEARGQFDAAYARYGACREVARRILGLTGETPEALRDLSLSSLLLGDAELARGDLGAAVDCACEQLGLLLRINTQLATWPSDAVAISERLIALASAGALPIEDALANRAEMWKRLAAHLDLTDVQVLERAQAEVARFHRLWLSLALEHAPERIPEVLAAMQGRKIAALVLEEVGHQTDGSGHEANPQLQQRFLSLRTELRRLALGLRVIGGNEGLGSRTDEGDPGDRRPGGMSISPGIYRASEAEYQVKLVEYQRCRAELARLPGYEALEPPQMQVSELRPTLPSGHALLILLQPPADGESRPAPHALLLTQDEYRLMPLPGLLTSVARVRAQAEQPQQVAGNRDGASTGGHTEHASDASIGTHAQDLEPDIGQALWAPLAQHLQGLSTLHVVTHGELHILPLGQDAPDGLQVHQYPGLVFYWLQHKAGSSPAPGLAHVPDLALQVHSPEPGEAHPPIPFVHAEARLVESLWRPVHTLLPFDQEPGASVVHLAGHGRAGDGQDAALLVGREQTLGLHELLRSLLRPQVVYLSACLVGRTSEDLDGEPLGMVSGFFLRGARSVIAPLVPISDLYSPLLAVLFHWELRRQHDQGQALDASQALQWAKARLADGDWPEEVVQRVRSAYAGTFKEALAEILHGCVRDAEGRTMDLHRELMATVRAWMLELYPIGVLADLRDSIDHMRMTQGPEAAARGGAEQLAGLLVDARQRLHQQRSVQDLLRYMQVYGAPRQTGSTACPR